MSTSPSAARRFRRKVAIALAGLALVFGAVGPSSRPALIVVVLIAVGLAVAGAHAVERMTGTRGS